MIIRRINFQNFTSIGIGGDGILYIPEKIEEIKNIKEYFFILGKGSNILVDERKTHHALYLENFTKISFEENLLTAEAGVLNKTLLRFCIENKIKTFNFLAGIPGTIGGTVAMNAGLPGMGIGSFVKKMLVYSLKQSEFLEIIPDKNTFSYRNSILRKKNYVVLKCYFEIEKESSNNRIKQNIKNIMTKKIQNQPYFEKTFGSIFKNPPGNKAWKLIEGAGLKGYGVNGVYISEKHSNFLINKGGGNFKDACHVIEKCRESVYNKYKISLEEEVIYI
ncbi:MAG: UDP-N-acetylmuramate dehydrogenase [Candidatus Muiribacteriota bacterium]